MDCLDFRYYLMYYFIYLLGCLFSVAIIETSSTSTTLDLEQQAEEEGKCSLTMFNLCPFSL
jgi:hypothetical protein